MVNAFRRSDDGPMHRSVALVLLLATTLAACAAPKDRDLARYYDPEGLSTASLPTSNTISVAPPELRVVGSFRAEVAPGLLTLPVTGEDA